MTDKKQSDPKDLPELSEDEADDVVGGVVLDNGSGMLQFSANKLGDTSLKLGETLKTDRFDVSKTLKK